MLKDVIMLLIVLFLGFIYYVAATQKKGVLCQYALFIKLFLLVLSFVLAFLGRDFITIGNLSFGGRTSVSLLVLVEIIDVLVDRQNKK